MVGCKYGKQKEQKEKADQGKQVRGPQGSDKAKDGEEKGMEENEGARKEPECRYSSV
jgi:hypothetical protein